MAVDPFRLAIALVPLAAYALLLGLINLRRRPMLVSGGCDLFVLGAALSGLVFVGPIELFRPQEITLAMGNYVWLGLLGFYWTLLLLAVLMSRPRIVLYNISLEELHPLLAEVVGRLDAEVRWAGNQLSLPRLGVQLHMEGLDLLRNVSLVSSGSRQSLEGWRRLARELSAALRPVRGKSNPFGAGLLALAAALLGITLGQMLAHPAELAQAVGEVFAF